VANLVLWSEAWYFDMVEAAKPLLHLWSPGIEEQIYLFCPLLSSFCGASCVATWSWRRC
jgi:peptidoglycan/LPS O-acetylase OafA/YrhL